MNLILKIAVNGRRQRLGRRVEIFPLDERINRHVEQQNGQQGRTSQFAQAQDEDGPASQRFPRPRESHAGKDEAQDSEENQENKND